MNVVYNELNIPKTISKMKKSLRSSFRSPFERSYNTSIKRLNILNTITFDAKQTQNTCQTKAGNMKRNLFYMTRKRKK